MSDTCNNCGSAISGKYCSTCGQRSNVGAVTYSELGDDLYQSLFSVESPLSITLRTLFLKPEKLFKEYLGGSRKKYYRPVAFFILMTAIYLVVRSLIDFESNVESMVITGENESSASKEASVFMIRNINKFLFLLVLGMGISLKVFFFKRLRLLEYWVIAFYITGIYTLLTIFGTVITVYGSKQIQPVIIFLALVYFIFCCIRFFKGNKFLVGIKAFFAFFIAMLIYVAGSFELSYLITSYLT
ncbi:DUF3667 domain-containing protein [Christiangramia aquimixticola]|uniref:DUF3667 domain-containing protein n=1 Tax=Christiangramia aquimixticola TaxID=1697558 RepID=UPI003AA91378